MGSIAATTLLELLGRQWHLSSPIHQVVLDRAETIVAFACADGRVALAPLADPEPAFDRFRMAGDTGKPTITPRRTPARPVVEVPWPDGPAMLAPLGRHDVFAASLGGGIRRIASDGTSTPMAGNIGPVHALVAMPCGGVLVASGASLVAYDGSGNERRRASVLDGRHVTALAVTADGRWLAQGGDGLVIRRLGDDAGSLTEEIADRCSDLPVQGLSWSPDGRWLAVALAVQGLALVRIHEGRVLRVVRLVDYPGPVPSLSWDASSRLLATGGAFRTIVWAVDQFERAAGTYKTLPTGRPGLIRVDSVALNPRRPIVAASSASGAITVAQVDSSDELLVRPMSLDASVGLTWTRDGRSLVFGTTGGKAVIADFPPQLFKSNAGADNGRRDRQPI